jgi:type II secretory pathway predicted ATPase ExeA
MTLIRQHFGLTQTPFINNGSHKAFSGEDLEQVIERLDLLTLSPGLALTTGEPGAGKTFAVGAWSKHLNPNEYTVHWLDDPGNRVSGFLRRIARLLGIAPAYRAEIVWEQLIDAIWEHHKDTAKHLVFILDESQDLPEEVLEQIRRLTNLGRHRPLPASFVLIAHREFLQRLNQRHLSPLKRRLSVQVCLQGLTRCEAGPYLNHHLEASGARRAIFQEEAIGELWSISRGLPRLFNLLALQSMVDAVGQQAAEVDAARIRLVAARETW